MKELIRLRKRLRTQKRTLFGAELLNVKARIRELEKEAEDSPSGIGLQERMYIGAAQRAGLDPIMARNMGWEPTKEQLNPPKEVKED